MHPLGRRLAAHNLARQGTKIQIQIAILNLFYALGAPQTETAA